tara:strand:+ start:565 stop:897 length:333 start_codon:yes stop_codon:yes gene_type:complete
MPFVEAILAAVLPALVGGAFSTAQSSAQLKQQERARRDAAEEQKKQMALAAAEEQARQKELRKKKMQLAEQSTFMSSDPGAVAVTQASVDPIGLVVSAQLPKKNQFIQNV